MHAATPWDCSAMLNMQRIKSMVYPLSECMVRAWNSYVHSPNEERYSENWNKLTPGKCYVVVQRSVSKPEWKYAMEPVAISSDLCSRDMISAAAVMRFVKYVHLGEPVAEQRRSGIELRKKTMQRKMLYWKETPQEQVEFVFDEEDTDFDVDQLSTLLQTSSAYANMFTYSLAEEYALVFESIAGDGRMHTIDPWGPIPGSATIEIYDIWSAGWRSKIRTYTPYFDPLNPPRVSSLSMQKADRWWASINNKLARNVAAEVAAVRIQRAWRKAAVILAKCRPSSGAHSSASPAATSHAATMHICGPAWDCSALLNMQHIKKMIYNLGGGTGIMRSWENYVHHVPPLRYHGYSHIWDELVPGKCYLVVQRSKTIERVSAAAVMRFVKYVHLGEPVAEQRRSGIELRMKTMQQKMRYWKETAEEEMYFLEDGDDDGYYYTMAGDYGNACDAYKNAFIDSLAEENALVFESIVGPERMHTIDPWGPVLGGDIIIEIYDVCSADWRKWDKSNGEVVWYTMNTLEIARMNKLVSLSLDTQRILLDVAAMRIQRAWRKAMMDPRYSLCKKRLREEHGELDDLSGPRKK